MISLAFALLSGCESAGDEITLSSEEVVRGSVSLVASQSSEEATRVESDLWESSDFIGLSTSTPSSDDVESNMCYMVESNGTMTNTDDGYVITVVGSKSYYAYYPYDRDLSDDNILSVDISGQDTMSDDDFKSLDLMWTKQEDIDIYQPTVYLLFEREMVHIDVTLFIYGDSFNETNGINLNGVYSTGELNVLTGNMEATGVKGDIKLRMKSVQDGSATLSDGSIVTTSIVAAEAYLLPMDSSSITFSYTSGSSDYATCTLDSGSLVSGNNYKFVITEGIESYALSDINGSAPPAGDFWVISDSDPVSSTQFGELRSALATAGNSHSSISLLFPNLTALPSGALKDCTALVSVNIPNVTTLNSYAFSGCSSLSNVEAPLLEYVAGYAFENCSLLSDLSTDSLNMVGEGAFSGCDAFTSFEADNLESIGDQSFANCNGLKLFNAPNLMWIGSRAFTGCSSIGEIIVGNESTTGITNIESGWVDSSRASYIELVISPILPSGVSKDGYKLTYADGTSDTFDSIQDHALMLSDFTVDMSSSALPSTDNWVLMDEDVVGISDFAGLQYALNNLVKSSQSITLTFPNLTSLPSVAFKDIQNFTSINAMSVTWIGANVFSGASSLTSIALGSSKGVISSLDSGWITTAESEKIDLQIYSSLPSDVAIQDNLLCFTADDGTTSIYFNTINGGGLTLKSFELFKNDPSSLPSITEWNITESGTPLGKAFDDLKSVLEGVSSDITLIFSELDGLPREALSGAEHLYKVSLEKATRIYYSALSSCSSLEIVDAPYVTTVSDSAFAESTNMKSISLPSAMVVGAGLFKSMPQLESLDLGSEASVSSYDNACFESMDENNSTMTTLTICSRDKFTSDMSIGSDGKTMLFDNPGNKYIPQLSYQFKEIIEK